MPDALVLDRLGERDRLLNTINVLKHNAHERGENPSATDLEVIERANLEIDKIDKVLKVIGEDREIDIDTREKLLRANPVQTPSVQYRSAGEMLWDCIHANFGSTHDVTDQDARSRWERVMKRAAEHMGTSAAATTPVAGGFGALYVAPVVGPVMDLAPQGQPFLSAVGRRPAPNSMSFTRPRLVDPDFKTGAAVQTLEKAELISKKFDVKVDTLSLATVGGYLNVSQQLLSLHPSAWDVIVTQLQRRVAWQGEAAAIAELDNTTAKVTLADNATAAATIAALYDAAALVYTNTNMLPTWLAYGPGGWAKLGKLCDTAGRPLFPFLGATNAIGSTGGLDTFNLGPLGLTTIVTPGITNTNIFMGNSMALEAYVFSFPVLDAVEPSVMGRQVSVAEAMGFYRPTTKEAVTTPAPLPAEANGAVLIGP